MKHKNKILPEVYGFFIFLSICNKKGRKIFMDFTVFFF